MFFHHLKSPVEVQKLERSRGQISKETWWWADSAVWMDFLPLKTNSSPLKNDGWKTIFLLKSFNFRGAFVSCGVKGVSCFCWVSFLPCVLYNDFVVWFLEPLYHWNPNKHHANIQSKFKNPRFFVGQKSTEVVFWRIWLICSWKPSSCSNWLAARCCPERIKMALFFFLGAVNPHVRIGHKEVSKEHWK